MPPRRRDTLPKSHRRVAGQPAALTGRPKRVSRREREERQRRQLFWGVGIAAVAVLLVLSGATLNEYWFKPRHVLASVNGVEIRRRDYWKYRAVDLANQASQYASIANSGFISQDQANQYSQLAQQTSAEIDNVWGSTDLDDATLQKMIDDQVYLQSVDDFGITITDQDVQDYIDMQYGQADLIYTPTPTQTLIPERAAWQTETAVAAAATESPTGGVETAATPVASPVAGSPESASPDGDGLVTTGAASPITEATENASPVFPASPVSSESASASESVASPVASSVVGSSSASPVSVVSVSGGASPAAASPVASPETTATETATATPNAEQARQTATANFASYQDAVFGRSHVSRADYIRLVVRPAIAKQRIDDQLTAGIGQSAEQVHAAHILVDTKDLADAIYQQVTQQGGNFEEIAKEQSIDSSTAPNGGDLGWFTRGQMVDAFEQVAFSTQPGQISQPVQTQFGWHIIKVYDHQNNRAMTDDQISQMKQSTIDKWLTAQKAKLKIESDIKPTETPSGLQSFVPPADAPPTPTATIETAPVASPEVPAASPIAASPFAVASPIPASPVAASPVIASPVGSAP